MPPNKKDPPGEPNGQDKKAKTIIHASPCSRKGFGRKYDGPFLELRLWIPLEQVEIQAAQLDLFQEEGGG